MKRFRRYSYLNVSLEQNEKDQVELKAKNKKNKTTNKTIFNNFRRSTELSRAPAIVSYTWQSYCVRRSTLLPFY